MYINQIDYLLDGILDRFYEYLSNENIFTQLSADNNFVKFHSKILFYIKNFLDIISKKDIESVTKNTEYIIDIIKRYCAFYIYLGIAYYYKGTRDLYIINIIESSKYQKDVVIQIPNFYNSENNSKIITFYNDIKNILLLAKLKTMDTIIITLNNNMLKYESIIKILNDLGEQYFADYFLVDNNFHNIIKTFIMKYIYSHEEKNTILSRLNQEELKEAEYKYIEIMISNEKKLIDFSIIQNFLTQKQLKKGLDIEIYNYLEEMKNNKQFITEENLDYINYLFSNKIIIPITEEFIRFHKDTEKYDKDHLIETYNMKDRDITKIKYIMDKMNTARNYYTSNKTSNQTIFYKPLELKMAVLYNENEDYKIIQKLKMSEKTTDIDSLTDLENIRKYAYVNFKNFHKDRVGIKLRPTSTIQTIRYININQKQNTPIELRIGNNNNSLNIIGIAWNPSKIELDCFETQDLINIKKSPDINGFKAFIKIMKSTFDTSKKNLYYWLFDTSVDIPILESYVNYTSTDTFNNIKIIMEQIYNNYIQLVKNKFINELSEVNDYNIWLFNNLIKNYKTKYFDFTLTPEIMNEITNIITFNKIKELPIILDEVDILMPGKHGNIIKLPSYKNNNNKKQKITILNEIKEIKEIELSNKNIAICIHYVKWNYIKTLSKRSDEFNQHVFNYFKQYCKIDHHGNYICKSCNEALPLEKYIPEHAYLEESDVLVATSMNTNVYQNLTDIAKYSKYTRTIRNIDKNIERIAFILNIFNYIGNSLIIKINRNKIIEKTIDLLLIHTEWLKKQQKNRKEQFAQKYGINKDLSILFIFELNDNIFISSTAEIDYYKKIKYNNILIYIIFIIITEFNIGQILNLKEDKNYNYLFFLKFGKNIFNDIFFRLNQKDKIKFENLHLLSYLIYYISGIVLSSGLWLYSTTNNNNPLDNSSKKLLMINEHKIIIHTIIDLINSLVEANLELDKHYLYELIITKFNTQITKIFNDSNLLKEIETKSSRYIKYDETTKKVSILKNKIDYIEINKNIIDPIKINEERCLTQTYEINKRVHHVDIININILTNCADGNFHNWVFESNYLECKLCKKSYNKLLESLQTTSENINNDNLSYLNKIKLFNLKKLSKKYCISGLLHKIDNKNICQLCGKNIDTFEPNNKELSELEKNISKKYNENILIYINKTKEQNDKNKQNIEKTKQIITKLKKDYKSDNIIVYINTFINKLITILGPKIKIDNNIIYLKETIYIIDHDYYGNSIKIPFTILLSENKIHLVKHNFFNKEILYYKDNANKVYVYYDPITLQYLGYSFDNINIKKIKTNVSLIINYSLKDLIMLLGYENQYLNIDNESNTISKETILQIIRTRINNLRQIIIRIKSIIFNIKNTGKIISAYNINEKNIINEFINKLKQFNINNEDSTIFKHLKYIISKLSIDYNIPDTINIPLSNKYLDINLLNSLNNTDIKLIYYLIYNFNKLLDYNTQPAVLSELAYLIIKLIKYAFNIYYKSYSNYIMRQFNYYIVNEIPYIDEKIKSGTYYQELLTAQEIDDPNLAEELYDLKEEYNALDIDDYDDQPDADDYEIIDPDR
jgi:hypothetical protein